MNECSRKTWLFLLLGIFLLALVLKAVYLREMKKSPYFDTPIIDAREYHGAAKEMARGDWFLEQEKIFHHGLLYPFSLALLYKFTSGDPLLIKSIQMILGSLGCVLVVILAAPLLGRGASLLAGLFAASYGAFICYEEQFLAEPLLLFSSLCLALILRWVMKRPSLLRAALFGLAIGVSSWCKGTILLLIPLLLPFLFLFREPEEKGGLSLPWRTTRVWLVILIFALAAVAPITVRNWIMGGDFVLTQSNVGLNFYIGNNPEADGTPNVSPGYEWAMLRELALKREAITPSDQSRYYLGQSLRFITEDPLRYVQLLMKKAYLFFHKQELGISIDLEHIKQQAPFLSFLPITYGLLSPLALLALFLYRKRLRGFLLPLLFAGLFFISGILFTVCARYRLPAVPFLIVLAAGTIRWGASQAALKKWRRLGGTFLVFALLWCAFNLPSTGIRQPNSHWMLGIAYKNKGLYEKALEEFNSLQKEGGLPKGTDLKVAVLIKQGRHGEAQAEIENAMKEDQKFAHSSAAHYNLGVLYAAQGNFQQAENAYRKAIITTPGHIPARINLGQLYFQQRLFPKAEEQYKKVLDLNLRHGQAHFNLGNIHLASKNYPKAESEFLQAIDCNPTLVSAHISIILLYLELEQKEKARDQFQKSQATLRAFGKEAERRLLRERVTFSLLERK